MIKKISDNALLKMESTCNTLKQDLNSLRTGRASASILDGIIVNICNNNLRLTQVATVNVTGNKMLTVNLWDSNNAEAVNKAISNSNLGLNPILEGATIKIPLPDLSQERRKELVKVANDYAERARIAMRNIRRDAINNLKDLNKSKEISEDELRKGNDNIQKITDNTNVNIDQILKNKSNEILDS